MPSFEQLLIDFFSPESIWSVILRAVFWVVIAFVIIISTDQPNPQRSRRKLRSNLGFALIFITLSTGLVYLLFGFVGI